MSQQLQDNEETLNEVNVIPLADLSLVLLIILMVLSPMVTQGLIQVAAANAQAAVMQQELTQPETPIIVSFQPGALKLNGQLMGSDLHFVKQLSTILSPRKDKSVILTASPEMGHGKVVHVMDLIRRHGATEMVMVKWDPSAPANQTETAAAPVRNKGKAS